MVDLEMRGYLDGMTKQQVALFEQGFAAYADGVARERLDGNKADLIWLLRGWDAGKEDNEVLNKQMERLGE